MLDIRPVFFILGILTALLGSLMAIPAMMDFATDSPDAMVFAMSTGFTVFAGVLMSLMARVDRLTLNLRQAFMLTTLSWLILPAFAAPPFMLADHSLSFTDAYFETVSGMTTTGSTVVTHIEMHPRGFLLWRAMLQWIGGVGIVVMGMSILPFLKVGGMQLFKMESSDRSEKVMPRAKQLISSIVQVNVGLTVACAISLKVAGMGTFDAICHAMTAIATGGYANYDASIAHFDSLAVQWVLTVFMLAGASTFVLFIRMMQGKIGPFFRDSQLRLMLGIVVVSALPLTALRTIWDGEPFFESLTKSFFHVSSILTTTGYASTDYTTWGSFAVCIFFFLTFMGGCSGSTGGGIKMFRLIVIYEVGMTMLKRMIMPNAIFIPRYQDRAISDELAMSVFGFGILWGFSWLMLSLGLSMTGLDLTTSLSGAATAIANVGPGLGDVIGPSGNFASIPLAAKWILIVGMLLGRLEMLTVMVLLVPMFWRK